MTVFALDPVIDNDTISLGDLPLCRVQLMNDARYPWLLLLPRLPGAVEIVDLAEADQMQLMREVAIASAAIRALYGPDKINVGSLGNKVRQMHMHVLGRFASDPAWPGPVWGHSPATPYPPHVLGITADRFRKALAERGLAEIGA